MPEYTPEQTEQAKEWLESGDEYDKEYATCILTALKAAEQELKEYENLIALQHTRTIKADKLWRHAHPEQQHKSPDLGTLVDWLLFRAKRAEAYAAKLEKAGDFMRGACPIIIARDNWDAARK